MSTVFAARHAHRFALSLRTALANRWTKSSCFRQSLRGDLEDLLDIWVYVYDASSRAYRRCGRSAHEFVVDGHADELWGFAEVSGHLQLVWDFGKPAYLGELHRTSRAVGAAMEMRTFTNCAHAAFGHVFAAPCPGPIPIVVYVTVLAAIPNTTSRLDGDDWLQKLASQIVLQELFEGIDGTLRTFPADATHWLEEERKPALPELGPLSAAPAAVADGLARELVPREIRTFSGIGAVRYLVCGEDGRLFRSRLLAHFGWMMRQWTLQVRRSLFCASPAHGLAPTSPSTVSDGDLRAYVDCGRSKHPRFVEYESATSIVTIELWYGVDRRRVGVIRLHRAAAMSPISNEVADEIAAHLYRHGLGALGLLLGRLDRWATNKGEVTTAVDAQVELMRSALLCCSERRRKGDANVGKTGLLRMKDFMASNVGPGAVNTAEMDKLFTSLHAGIEALRSISAEHQILLLTGWVAGVSAHLDCVAGGDAVWWIRPQHEPEQCGRKIRAADPIVTQHTRRRNAYALARLVRWCADACPGADGIYSASIAPVSPGISGVTLQRQARAPITHWIQPSKDSVWARHLYGTSLTLQDGESGHALVWAENSLDASGVATAALSLRRPVGHPGRLVVSHWRLAARHGGVPEFAVAVAPSTARFETHLASVSIARNALRVPPHFTLPSESVLVELGDVRTDGYLADNFVRLSEAVRLGHSVQLAETTGLRSYTLSLFRHSGAGRLSALSAEDLLKAIKPWVETIVDLLVPPYSGQAGATSTRPLSGFESLAKQLYIRVVHVANGGPDAAPIKQRAVIACFADDIVGPGTGARLRIDSVVNSYEHAVPALLGSDADEQIPVIGPIQGQAVKLGGAPIPVSKFGITLLATLLENNNRVLGPESRHSVGSAALEPESWARAVRRLTTTLAKGLALEKNRQALTYLVEKFSPSHAQLRATLKERPEMMHLARCVVDLILVVERGSRVRLGRW